MKINISVVVYTHTYMYMSSQVRFIVVHKYLKDEFGIWTRSRYIYYKRVYKYDNCYFSLPFPTILPPSYFPSVRHLSIYYVPIYISSECFYPFHRPSLHTHPAKVIKHFPSNVYYCYCYLYFIIIYYIPPWRYYYSTCYTGVCSFSVGIRRPRVRSRMINVT